MSTADRLLLLWREKFSHVYCVSYAPYKERRQKLIEELKRVSVIDRDDDPAHPFFSFHYTVPNAFERNLLHTPWFRYPTNNKRFNIGALSLAMGHYHVMQEALAFDYHRVLVIEDDIAFLKDLNKLHDILKDIPNSDIVMFDKITPQKDKWEKCISEKEGNYYIRTPKDLILWTTSCFSLTPLAMKSICERQEKFFNVADYYINYFKPKTYVSDQNIEFGDYEYTRSAAIKSIACQRPAEDGTISDHGENNSVYSQEGQYDCGINLNDYNI